MLLILALGYQGRGEESECSVSESITNGKSDKNPFFQISLNIVLIMIGICWCVVKATKNKKLKDLSGFLKCFIKSIYLQYDKGVYVSYYYLSFDFV